MKSVIKRKKFNRKISMKLKNKLRKSNTCQKTNKIYHSLHNLFAAYADAATTKTLLTLRNHNALLKPFPVFPLVKSLCLVWLKVSCLHPRPTRLHEIMPSLARAVHLAWVLWCPGWNPPQPSKMQHRFRHTNLSWIQTQPQTNCRNIRDESPHVQPLPSFCPLLADARQPRRTNPSRARLSLNSGIEIHNARWIEVMKRDAAPSAAGTQQLIKATTWLEESILLSASLSCVLAGTSETTACSTAAHEKTKLLLSNMKHCGRKDEVMRSNRLLWNDATTSKMAAGVEKRSNRSNTVRKLSRTDTQIIWSTLVADRTSALGGERWWASGCTSDLIGKRI